MGREITAVAGRRLWQGFALDAPDRCLAASTGACYEDLICGCNQLVRPSAVEFGLNAPIITL